MITIMQVREEFRTVYKMVLDGAWNDSNRTRPDLTEMKEKVQGDIRTVIGQARLVMAERFAQFSGLVDNCELRRGEKETTCQDLLGFWEMIYFQVTDVDSKFTKLAETEKNNWQEVEPKPVQASKARPSKKKVMKVVKPGASSGLKAMIAAKRKEKTEGTSNDNPGRLSVKEMMAKKRAEMAEKKEEDKEKVPDNLFDGGFFQVSSPVRSSPQVAPRSPRPSTPVTSPVSGEKSLKVVSSDSLRRSVLTESSRRSVSGLLLSPFISQVARRSLTPASSPGLKPATPPTAILVNLEDSSEDSSSSNKLGISASPSRNRKNEISLSKTPRTPTYPVRRSSRISLVTPK